MLDSAHRLAHALRVLRPASAPARLHSLTPDGSSWLLHAPKYWPADEEELSGLWTDRPVQPTSGVIFGKRVDFPRRTAAYGYDYKYTGQTQQALPLESAHALVATVLRQLQAAPGAGLGGHNAALMNWYDASLRERMGSHSDDEAELVRHAPIVSLSWCSPGHYRRFRLTAKAGVGGAVAGATVPTWLDAPGVLRLSNGCLVVMGGTCQATHKHEIMPPTKQLGEAAGRRINLTLRAFVPGPGRQASSSAEASSRGPSSAAPAARVLEVHEAEEPPGVRPAAAPGTSNRKDPSLKRPREQGTLSSYFARHGHGGENESAQ